MPLSRTEPMLGHTAEGPDHSRTSAGHSLRPEIPIWALSQQVTQEMRVKLS